MSYGFIAYNSTDEVLISSDTRNLHFIGKADGPTIADRSSAYGGFVALTYVTWSNVPPVPFFTMPDDQYYGIASIKNVGGNRWEILVIRSGTGTAYPELYIFADPRSISPSDSYGLVVYCDDETPSFDSRLKPLAVVSGTSVTHTSNPRTAIGVLDDWQCSSGYSGNAFAPNTESAAYPVFNMPAKPMFHYSSLAQAEREAIFSGRDEECTGVDAYGWCLGYETHDSWFSRYWAFYRGGIRKAGNDLYAGWICVKGGCNWKSWSDSGFFGISLDDNTDAGGVFPYSNETINLSSAAVIVANASRYD